MSIVNFLSLDDVLHNFYIDILSFSDEILHQFSHFRQPKQSEREKERKIDGKVCLYDRREKKLGESFFYLKSSIF